MSQAQDSEACSLAPLPVHNQAFAPQVTIAELVFDGNLQVPIGAGRRKGVEQQSSQ